MTIDLKAIRAAAEAANLYWPPETEIRSGRWSAIDKLINAMAPQTVIALLDRLEAAEKALAEPAGEPVGWQPIETAPRYGRLLVTGTEIGTCVASAGWDTGTPDSIRWEVVNEIYVTPTHWMPLPAVPGATSPPPPAEPAVEPVAVHQVKLDARRWRDIAKDEMQNYIAKGFWETRTLYTSPPPPAESVKPPGMAVQALAGEIVAALLADEKDGGYDLTAGMFGPAFSVLVRRWAAAEWNSPPAEPVRTSQDVCTVPLLSDEEIEQADDSMCGEREFSKEFARAIEQLVRRKAGL